MGETSVLCWKAVGRSLSSVAITGSIDREEEGRHTICLPILNYNSRGLATLSLLLLYLAEHWVNKHWAPSVQPWRSVSDAMFGKLNFHHLLQSNSCQPLFYTLKSVFLLKIFRIKFKCVSKSLQRWENNTLGKIIDHEIWLKRCMTCSSWLTHHTALINYQNGWGLESWATQQ